MEKKPIIGIIGRIEKTKETSEIRINEDYRLAIVKSGGIPIIILPTDAMKYGEMPSHNVPSLSDDNKQSLIESLELCDGIIMPGGTHWYQCDEIICKYALDNNVPLIGICLGMQIMGNVDNFFKTISSDKTVKNNTQINHNQKFKQYVHECFMEEGLLHEIFKVDKIKVNSRHNYHIEPKEYFKVEAYSEDKIIEAISMPNHKFALGVQWHPENMIEYDENMKKIFDKFIEIAKKHKKSKF